HIGFHPSENTFKNINQFKKEYQRLQAIAKNPTGGRHHHLLYDSESFSTWDSLNLKYDSGYGFQFRNGFRCGICYDYPVFDVYKREVLKLREVPFIVMDSVFVRNNYNAKEIEDNAKYFADITYKYKGIF